MLLSFECDDETFNEMIRELQKLLDDVAKYAEMAQNVKARSGAYEPWKLNVSWVSAQLLFSAEAYFS